MKRFAVIAILVSGILIIAGIYLSKNELMENLSKLDNSKDITKNTFLSNSSSSPHFSSRTITKTIKQASPSRDSKNDVDVDELAQYVGKDTATALVEKGPYEPRHVRTIAHSLNNMEKEIDELRKQNASPERIQATLAPYYQLQNHYYAILNELEPYEPDEESAKRLTDFGERLQHDGNRLSEGERKELKREMLLSPNTKDLSSAR